MTALRHVTISYETHRGLWLVGNSSSREVATAAGEVGLGSCLWLVEEQVHCGTLALKHALITEACVPHEFCWPQLEWAVFLTDILTAQVKT